MHIAKHRGKMSKSSSLNSSDNYVQLDVNPTVTMSVANQSRLMGRWPGSVPTPPHPTAQEVMSSPLYSAPTETLMDLWVAKFGNIWVKSTALMTADRDTLLLLQELNERGVLRTKNVYDGAGSNFITLHRITRYDAS